jgi:hypothetical protein
MGVGGYAMPLTIGYLGIGCFHATASIIRYLGSDVSLRSGFNCHNIVAWHPEVRILESEICHRGLTLMWQYEKTAKGTKTLLMKWSLNLYWPELDYRNKWIWCIDAVQKDGYITLMIRCRPQRVRHQRQPMEKPLPANNWGWNQPTNEPTLWQFYDDNLIMSFLNRNLVKMGFSIETAYRCCKHVQFPLSKADVMFFSQAALCNFIHAF